MSSWSRITANTRISPPKESEAWTGVHLRVLSLAILLNLPLVLRAESIPDDLNRFLDQHCLACHSGAKPHAEIQLDITEINWETSEAVNLWERVYNALDRSQMPPPGAAQPSPAKREQVVIWLEERLLQHSPVGGTPPRRLNRLEYRNTIRDLFDLSTFELPDAFPADDSSHGFDNIGEGLILSPPLLAQYLEVATAIADEIVPPARGPRVAAPGNYPIGLDGLAQSEGNNRIGDRYRLVSSRNMASTAAWPSRFEATDSGVYQVTITATPFETDEMFYESRTTPFKLEVYARPKIDQVYAPFTDLRRLTEFDVQPKPGKLQRVTAEVELIKGEIFGLRWANGPAYSDPPKRDFSRTFLTDRLKRDRLFYAAMLAYGGGPRGATQVERYEATRALMESGTLDLTDPRLDTMPKDMGGGLSSRPHNWIKAYVQEELHRFGPALDILDVEIEGPLRLIEDDDARASKARTKTFLGEDPTAETVLSRFLPRAFRRPVSDNEVATYAKLAATEPRLEDGLHLAIRRALISPNFLYRGTRTGPLDEFGLANRLSYFLTLSPPDAQLITRAGSGELSDAAILASETMRLVESPKAQDFIESFTGQWLGTRVLADIMPDPRLLQFNDPDRDAMIDETELFFAEMIRENHAVEAFIDPGFSYRSARLNKIYGGDLTGNQMRRVTFERGGRHGGILGLASVMMATANGVDTHPVERGVWLLENVFGMPPPPPPANVPAIAPDTSGATTIRDQLNRHRSDPSCAVCHKRIDPLGMVMENFDPVGRWRDNYPRYIKPPDGAEALKEEFYSSIGKGVTLGPKVDAIGTMPDGTRLEDITDLKRYVLANIDLFATCLTEKLLTYATGRPPSFGDKEIAAQIVAETKGMGFRDLIVAVVKSESFRTK